MISLDILPTALAAAGITPPTEMNLSGLNLLPCLTGQQAGPPHEALFWRYDGQRAVRMGEWKLLHASKKTRLFNLVADPGERHDLAAQQPGKIKALETTWQQWNAQNKAGKHTAQGQPATTTQDKR